MTAIVGVTQDGEVWLGGDTVRSSSDDAASDPDPKVWRSGDILLGYTGENRTCQLIRYSADIPPVGGLPPIRYLVTKLVPSIYEVIKDRESNDGIFEMSLLVGMSGRLFTIDCSLSVTDAGSRCAIGSGGDVASGAMDALVEAGVDLTPERLIVAGLRSAGRRCLSVGPPYDVITTARTRRKRYAR